MYQSFYRFFKYINTYLLLLPPINLFIKKQNKNNTNKTGNNLTIDIKSILLKLKLNFDSEYKYKKTKANNVNFRVLKKSLFLI